MKRFLAKKASAILSASAMLFVMIMKPAWHSPKAPAELLKK